jgi:prevent-host-death family protein
MHEVAQRELRNNVSGVLRRVEQGESLLVTVDRRPVALLSPLPRRKTWRPVAEVAATLRQADPGLADVLADLDPPVEDL